MSLRQFLILISALFVVGAIVTLAIPVHASAGGHNFTCGNGFSEDASGAAHEARVDDLSNALAPYYGNYGAKFGGDTKTYVASCDSAVTIRRAIGWPIGGLGAVGLLGGLLVRPGVRREGPATRPA